MPGILPMKVIKVGLNAQTRIAQACDRCRSKKIRCDGIRPCCSQCANVGFECKTSDKLSRRAFPRGYTESLEERVRGLEQEVRELKDLLDEKDEKIDMLSRLHSQSSHQLQLPSPQRPQSATTEATPVAKIDSPPKDDIFQVQQSPYLLDDERSDSYFAGTSSGRTFIEAFKHRVQETGRSTHDIDVSLLLASSVPKTSDVNSPASTVSFKAPARMVSDQMINIFFQEWAPLFPVLHRPTFLTLYGRYVADPDDVTDKAEIAQLNLVFGIAALSTGTRSSPDLDNFEAQWKAALDGIIQDNTMATLQALILAQLYCVQKGDLTRVLTYKGLSTVLCARLGLHQSQKRFALGTLTCETRKKVFWTLYTIDSFTAVLLGLPKQLKDDDAHCEMPVDADDEYVTERGFQPTLPGESTKVSSALALFQASRILSKVLEEVFPAKTSYELSLKKLSELSDELENWSAQLPQHLRLQFAQDKPSTGTISSRSPLLSLTYHYIRSLIQRPVIGASLGARSQSSMLTMASSCKHMIQIVQLLDERGLGFSFCLNRDELLVISGFGLLFQGLGLETNSKILKDNSKMLAAVIGVLKKTSAPCATEFERVANSFVPATNSSKSKSPSLSRHNSDGQLSTNSSGSQSSTRKQLKAIASRFTSNSPNKNSKPVATDSRRATVHQINLHPYSQQTSSMPSLQPQTSYSPTLTSRSEPARSPVNLYSRPQSTAITNAPVRPSAPPQLKPKPNAVKKKLPNLDYLSFGNEPETTTTPPNVRSTQPVKTEPGPTDWEKLLGSLDNGDMNIHDSVYGGAPLEALMDTPNLNSASTPALVGGETPIAWSQDLWALCQTDTNTTSTSSNPGLTPVNNAPASILSFSSADDGLSGSEDFGTGNSPNDDWTLTSGETFRGFVVPADDAFGSTEWISL
ncbi:Transcriptional activator protein acu-15 [Cercospora beticola]|uniref:Transcriptional activator protein acu-15 n=1 Tax=Cercospora beticola TaxID=122368 RepID=A0A2G5I9V2_CERBT|nr:Transcriptional activator protein acu-15 [Cercospora beticola]PIB01549.1 Transcriptional activator protein acu-15 [Cercospora beticola]WPA96074.1 hypothetical protein RHO25_000680 [Cercospora beticola]